MQDDIVIKIRTELVEGKYELSRIRKEFKKGTISFETMARAEDALARKTLELNKAMGKAPFAGWAMSIMFAGMALQRMATSVWKFGVKAFDEISHSVEGTVTKNDMLQGSMKYLGFVIGDALEPIIGWLIPIIDKIAEWVEENPKLVATLVGAGGLVGAIAAVGGAAKLAKDGVTNMVAILNNTDWAAIGDTVRKSIGVISIFYAVYAAADAFKDLSEGKLGKALLDAISSGLTGYGGLLLIKDAKAGAPLILIGIGFKLLSEGKFFQTITSFFGLLFAYVETWVETIMNNFRAGFIQGILGTVLDIVKTLSPIGLIPGAADAIHKLKSMMGIQRFNFGEEFISNYKTGMQNAREADKVVNYYIDKLSIESDNLDEMNASINQVTGN